MQQKVGTAPHHAPARKPMTLALQGGGAHGAFTWGVLDRLLEEPSLDIEAISGTSAGAMNAAALADGMAKGGPVAAKQSLHAFWKAVSEVGGSVFDPSRYLGDWPAMQGLTSFWSEALTHVWSPYDNPSYVNPLERVVADVIDFERLRKCRRPQIYVCATNVRTNERKIFRGQELTAKALLASACLPTYFRAVEVDGEHYWDGGYVGNPPLAPLLAHGQDLLIVELNAIRRDEIPKSAEDIVNRLNEITFDSALVQEIQGIENLNRLIASGELATARHRYIRFHVLPAGPALAALGAGTKNDTDWAFLTHLHGLGRRAAGAWLDDSERFGKVGRECTVDVEEHFLRRTGASHAR